MRYAGDVLPEQCWQDLKENSSTAFLIDVRTRPEWVFVGTPTMAPEMHPLILKEWQTAPETSVERFVDMAFAEQVGSRVRELGGDETSTLYFICRSGIRSMAAADAVADAGFKRCFNVLNGVEGDMNEMGQRGKLDGWKAANLPWQLS